MYTFCCISPPPASSPPPPPTLPHQFWHSLYMAHATTFLAPYLRSKTIPIPPCPPTPLQLDRRNRPSLSLNARCSNQECCNPLDLWCACICRIVPHLPQLLPSLHTPPRYNVCSRLAVEAVEDNAPDWQIFALKCTDIKSEITQPPVQNKTNQA
jgi:hypothetical protein